MGFLNPLFLLAGVAIGIPIFLHLFQRQQTLRIAFPALRYLERTEREHAKQIRFRQLLLLLARIVLLLLVVGAGARTFVSGRSGTHAPTATVIVLDNSMSSGLVVGEVRVLDELKALATQTLDQASDDDRFWVIRAGEPWLPAIPGRASDARAAVESTEPTEAAGDLTAALERAARLLETTDLEEREIHLLSDLQNTAFSLPGQRPAGDVPVVVWRPRGDVAANRALAGVTVGGGLPPLEGQRTQVTITSMDPGPSDDSSHVALRLVVNERIRGATTLPAGSQTSIAMPPSGTGWIEGYVDADPDALRADDRRYFAYRSRPAPTVATRGDQPVFVSEALGVLESAGRIRLTDAANADLVASSAGIGLDERGPSTAALIVPPADATVLPALNRRLADAGIPWRFGASERSGQASVEGQTLPAALEGVRALQWFDLELSGDPAAPPRTLAEVDGSPWAVEGMDTGGRRYLLIASPMDARATTLPVSTGMLQFVDWVASEWAGAGGGQASHEAGANIPAPGGATHVRFPTGRTVEIDGARTVRGTGEAGFYTFLSADTVVAVVATNTPAEESRLGRLDRDDLEEAIGPGAVEVDREAAWAGAIFRSRQGPELWWPLLLAMMALLLVEGFMATSGRADTRKKTMAAPADALG